MILALFVSMLIYSIMGCMIDLFLKINGLLIQRAYAQSLGETLSENLEPPAGDEGLESLVDRIVSISVPVAITAAFILLSYGGYLLISSEGNPEKLQEAKSLITNAIIGLLVVVLSVVILLIISGTIGDVGDGPIFK